MRTSRFRSRSTSSRISPFTRIGTFTQELLQTKPGDYVALRAEMDAIIVLSACPHDVLPVYGPMGPTSMAIEVLTDA